MKFKQILILFLICGQLFANNTVFRHLTPQDGLNDGTINDIVQDNIGLIWMATWDGIMSYDGINIKYYKPVIGDKNSLPAKQCRTLFIDSNGNLWVGGRSFLSRYVRSHDHFINYSFQDPADMSPLREIVNYEDFLIVRTGTNRLLYTSSDISLTEGILKKLPLTDESNTEVSGGITYMCTVNNNLLVCIRSSGPQGAFNSTICTCKFIEEPVPRIIIKELLTVRGHVTSIASNDPQSLYIGTNNGVYVYYTAENNLISVPKSLGQSITDLNITHNKKLWIATRGSGLGCLDLHTGKYDQYQYDLDNQGSILGNILNSLFEDFSGNLWIGHSGEGISILNLNQKPFITLRHNPEDINTLSENTVLCFGESGDELLVGTNNTGLNIMHFDPDKGEYIFRNVSFGENIRRPVERIQVWHIAKETNSIFWLGTNIGLIKAVRENSSWYFRQYIENENELFGIRRLLFDSNGNLWLGTYSGLYLIPFSHRESMAAYRYTHNEWDSVSLSDNSVTALLIDRQGNFWVGTQNGGINLLITEYADLDLSGNTKPDLNFRRFIATGTKDNILNNNEINCFYENPDGTIWVGTQGGGMNLIDPETFKPRQLTIKDGLPGNNIFGILPDETGDLWLSTNKGLTCFKQSENKFINYTPADGIQGNIFMVNAYYKDSDGKLYFGGRNGFTFFDPSRISINTNEPKIYLSGLQVFNNDIAIGDSVNGKVLLPVAINEMESVTLTHKEKEFSILFSIIHFQNPEENLAEYMLEGWDDHWNLIPASPGRITFANLPDGYYILKIRAANSDNLWSAEHRELRINILPPWWGMTWARISIFLLISAIVAGLMMLLLHRQYLKHSLQLEKKEKENLRNLNESKLSFFTNISHELRTPISLITAPVEYLLANPHLPPSFFNKQLKLIHRNARLLHRLTSQIIDLRKMSAGKIKLNAVKNDLGKFICEILENFEYIREEKSIDLLVNLPDNPFPVWYDPPKMEEIIYNLLSNAFKYTGMEGHIMVSLSKSSHVPDSPKDIEEWAVLTIFNDGSEIPEDKLEMIFERFYKINESAEGSGIGLAFARSLVELHHGIIRAESGKDKGVTFKVYLPCGDSHLQSEEKGKPGFHFEPARKELVTEKNEEDTEQNVATEDHDLSILFVEDNKELRGFFKILCAGKYNFFEAGNGKEGYRLVEDIIPDIVISDIVMPVMNGYDLCEKIKENPKTSHIPVILLSEKDTQEHRISGFNSGADAYVVKPFEIKVLEAQILRLIKNRQLLQENYRQNNYIIDIKSNNLSKDDHFLNKVREIIESNLPDPDFGVVELSRELFLSKTQIYRKVKALTGHPPIEFIRMIRLIKATEYLRQNQYSVKEVCFKTGFNNTSYFIKCFKAYYHVTPNEYSLSSHSSASG